MKWLLDANVLSESVRRYPDRTVSDWIAARAPEQLAISVVSLAELRVGAALADNETRRRSLSNWIDTYILPFFANRVLPLSLDILIRWLEISRTIEAQGRPRTAPDTLLAATAAVHELIVVSRNVRDFAGTGVSVFDPWRGKMHY